MIRKRIFIFFVLITFINYNNTVVAKCDVIESTTKEVPINICFSQMYGEKEFTFFPQIEDDGRTYFYFPSSFDSTNVLIYAPIGSKIFGSNGELIEVEISPQSINLASFFDDDFKSGREYALFIQNNEIDKRIIIVKSNNVASIHIDLFPIIIGGSGIDYLHQSKSNKLPGNITLINSDGEIELMEELTHIKGRGNSTWGDEKRPYNLKLKRSAELIPDSGEARKWCLLENSIMHQIAFSTYQDIGGFNVMQTRQVDLYIDSNYMGAYLLTEKVEIDKSRINIRKTENYEDESGRTTITNKESPSDEAVLAGIQAYQYASDSVELKPGGFLLEIDSNYQNEASWFVTNHGVSIVIKDPEYATKEQVKRIAIFVQLFEDALFSETGVNAVGGYTLTTLTSRLLLSNTLLIV